MIKYFPALKKDSPTSGYTMIELIMVMAIIGALASLFLVNYPGSQRTARDTQRQSDIKQYQTALETYANANDGLYPDTSGPLPNVCTSFLNTASCPNDPKAPPPYSYEGSPTEYFIWATLEVKDENGDIQYFVSCSNGLSGKTTTDPGGVSSCPL